jgi:hypothetical protein
MDNILKFPIIPKRVYDEYKLIKKVQISDTTSLKKLLSLLITDSKSSKKKEENILAKLILFDFKNYLSHPVIQKDNNSAKALEQRLAIIGEGKTSDTFNKKDPDISVILSTKNIETLRFDILQKIASNYRDKGDVIFFNSVKNTSYKISIKTLVKTNKEFNFGAFEWTTLVTDILNDEYKKIGERKNEIALEIDGKLEVAGRGSRAKLLSLFKHIQFLGKWDEFLERWKILFEGVFKEDIVVFMKDYKKLSIYVISNEAFCSSVYKSLTNAFINPKGLILNRWEGNSIRMDRDLLLEHTNFTINEEYDNLFDEGLIQNKIQNIENLKYKELINIFKN